MEMKTLTRRRRGRLSSLCLLPATDTYEFRDLSATCMFKWTKLKGTGNDDVYAGTSTGSTDKLARYTISAMYDKHVDPTVQILNTLVRRSLVPSSDRVASLCYSASAVDDASTYR